MWTLVASSGLSRTLNQAKDRDKQMNVPEMSKSDWMQITGKRPSCVLYRCLPEQLGTHQSMFRGRWETKGANRWLGHCAGQKVGAAL